jgi:hypothetical protein
LRFRQRRLSSRLSGRLRRRRSIWHVTNLLLREGDYAHLGAANVSIIDTDSYWVDGYFEETKLARLCVGDRAEAKLMGYSAPITGDHGNNYQTRPD